MMQQAIITPDAVWARWYALRCITGKEATAAEKVGALDIQTWVPIYRTLTKPTKKRKPVSVSRPLLPGYILAQVPQGRWAHVVACSSVIGWIAGSNGMPAPILPRVKAGRQVDEIADMRERERLGLFDHDGIEGRLKDGDPLEVLFGPFAGWTVTFKAARGQMIEADAEFLGAPRRVKIPARDVKLSK